MLALKLLILKHLYIILGRELMKINLPELPDFPAASRQHKLRDLKFPRLRRFDILPSLINKENNHTNFFFVTKIEKNA